MKYFKYFYITTLIILFLGSCNEITLEDVQNSENFSDELLAEREILKETSFIVGKILNNKQARDEVLTKMKLVDEKDFIISLHALMGHDSKMIYKELEKLNELKPKNNTELVFRKLFMNEINKNEIDYPNLTILKKKFTENELISKSFEDNLDVNAKIYIPYLDVNEEENQLGDDFYVSYDLLTFQDTHTAYKIDENGNVIDEVEIDFEYVNNNRVVGIVPIHPCDYDPNDCGYIESNPLLIDTETDNYYSTGYNPLTQFDPNDNDYVGGGSWYEGCCQNEGISNQGNIWDGSGNTQNTSYLVVTNENHTGFNDENFLLSTEFTAYRSKSSAWMRMFDDKLRHKFYVARGTKINVNSDGTVTPGPESEYLAGSAIKRRRASRDHRWYDARVALDYDWSLRKEDQTVLVFTEHSISSNASVTLDAKFGIGVDDGQFEPTAQTTVNISVPISRSKSQFRASKKITRKFTFNRNVGKGPLPDDECLNYEGHCYFIHEMYHTSFIMRHFVTPISE